MDELTADRSSYLSALARQKDNLNRNNNILVNPSVSDATTFGNSNDLNYYQQKSRNSNVSNVVVDNRNWWQRTWDTIADFRNNITKGFLTFIDGIGDFFGTITGSIAEAAGNHQMAEDIKNKWINVDWVTPTTQALSKLNIVEAYQTGDLFTKDYWTKLDSNYNTAKENSYFKDNELVQTISSGIGSVLPSIGLGVISGGVGTALGLSGKALTGFQAVSTLAPLGVSAAGNQAQEALEDNATFGQALGSGAISGGIEIGTELASAGIGKLGGKILQKMGFTKAAKVVTEASKSVNGYRLGKEALEETAKMGFKGFTVGAISEGLEEVASEFFSPLAKMVYKDNAWDEKWGTPEAKKQTMKEFGLAFIGGAIGSLVGGTVSKGMAKSQLAQQQAMEEKFGGQKGLELALTVDEIGQLTKEQALEFNKGNNGQQANIELIEENTNKINQLTEEYQKGIAEFEKNDPVNYQKFATAMMDAVKTPKMSMKLKGSDLLTPEEANKPNYFKQKQFEIINNTNPMNDDYHVGIRNVNDIKTFEEVLQLNDETEGQFAWGDYTREDAIRDLKNGNITVYSSKPIENGNFVSTSYIQAEQYAGGRGSKVYSKNVNINQIAWINGDEGQVAMVDIDNKSNKLKGKTYVSIYKTNEILLKMIDNLNNKLGNNQYVELPVNKNIMEQRAFTEINSRVDPNLQANKLMTLLENSNVRERTSQNGAYKVVGTIKEILTTKQLGQIKKALTQILEHSKTTTPNKAMAKVIDRISVMLKENTNRIKSVHNIGKLKTSVNEVIKNNFEITNDTISKVGLDFLFKPFVDLKFDSNGKGYKTNGLRENLVKVLDYYTPEKFNLETEHAMTNDKTINLEFNPAIRSNLEQILEALPAKNTTLDAETLKLVEKTMRMIRKDSIKARTKEKAVITPYAKNTAEAISNHSKDSFVKSVGRAYNRAFMPAYMLNRSITGYNSTLSDLVSTKMINAQNEKTLYIGDFQSNLYEKIKSLKIKPELAKMYEVKVNGHSFELNGSELVNLYNNLHTKDNFEAVNDSGLAREYHNRDSKTETFDYVKGHAEELMKVVDSNMSNGMKEIAKYLKGELNGKIKEDYANWFKSKYGEYNYLNTIEDYWTLRRKGFGVSSVEKMIRAPKAFDNGKSRVNNVNPVLLVDAFDSIGSYVNDLAIEQYVKPVYRDTLRVLNNKYNGTNKVAELIEKTYGAKDLQVMMNSINDMVGLKTSKDGMFSTLTGKYAVAKLSMNISTMMKQYASMFTSNIPMSKSAKALLNKFTFNSNYKTEFNQLVDEIGGLKYREGVEYAKGKVGAAQAGDVLGAQFKNKALNAISSVGMKGISAVDMFTIKTGVYSLMAIGEAEGYKVGTPENIKFVKENWSEFEASQISNNPMSKNALSRGDYGSTMKAVFGFMQGANRACLGSQFNKITTWLRNHNLNYDTIKSNFETAKVEFDNVKTQYETATKQLNDFIDNADMNSKTLENDYKGLENKVVELTEKLSDARQKYEDARLQRRDYNQYKIMGGKAIPLHVASGLVAQGIFVTAITELVKRMTGKKDWDDWDMKEILPSLALNTAVSWIPFANAITSMIQYEKVSYGGLGMLEDMVNVYSKTKAFIEQPTAYNRGQFLKALFSGVGDITGMPIQTLWDYTYGMIKVIDPDTALDMRNVLYPVTAKGMRNTITEYIEKGRDDKAATELVNMMKRFNNSEISSTLAEEMIKLTKEGYSVIPSTPNTEYTNAKGEKSNLSSDQIESMNQFYSKASLKMDNLLNSKEYRSLSNENKAKTINSIYSMYAKVGKAKALKDSSTLGHVGKIVYATTNIPRLPQMFAVLTKLNTIEADKKHTKKENILDYINKLMNYTKAEKSLIMYMYGYNLSGSSLKSVKSYLASKGVKSKLLKEIFGE